MTEKTDLLRLQVVACSITSARCLRLNPTLPNYFTALSKLPDCLLNDVGDTGPALLGCDKWTCITTILLIDFKISAILMFFWVCLIYVC